MTHFHAKPNTFVSQVNLNVMDLKRSLTFYEKIMGFKILSQTDTKAILTADGKTPLLTIEQPADVTPKQPRRSGLYHYALLLPKRSDLAKLLLHLVQSGYPIQGASDHYVSEALYLADPDGNGIEVAWDRQPSTWNWTDGIVDMATVALDAEGLLAEVNGESWNGLPTDTIMGHLHLHVGELQKTREFYCDGLGFDVVCDFANQALFLSTGQYHHHIAINIWNGMGVQAPTANSVGLTSYVLVFPSEESRATAIEKIKNQGATVTEENGVYLTKDPSGNRIQLTV